MSVLIFLPRLLSFPWIFLPVALIDHFDTVKTVVRFLSFISSLRLLVSFIICSLHCRAAFKHTWHDTFSFFIFQRSLFLFNFSCIPSHSYQLFTDQRLSCQGVSCATVNILLSLMSLSQLFAILLTMSICPGWSGSFRQSLWEKLLLSQEVQKRPLGFLNSFSKRSLGVAASNPIPNCQQFKGLQRCDWTFVQLCPSGIRMAHQIYLYKNECFIMIND